MSERNSYSVTEAKSCWSELLKRVAQGERITLTKWGVPIGVLVPPDFKEYLMHGGGLEEVDLSRDQSPGKDVKL